MALIKARSLAKAHVTITDGIIKDGDRIATLSLMVTGVKSRSDTIQVEEITCTDGQGKRIIHYLEFFML